MAGGIDWFRWHHGSVTDPKFQLVARKSKQSLATVIAVWAFVLEKASASEDRGHFGGLDYESVDCMFGLDDGATQAILSAMADRGLVDADRVASWEKRQVKRERADDVSTDRVKAFRSKERQETPKTNDETPCNAMERQETPREEKRREEEIREEKEEKTAPRKRVTTPVTAKPDDIDPQTWADWLNLRKAKRAPVTTTVVDEARRECAKAGMTLENFLRVWCRRGSQGLEAAWLKPDERGHVQATGETPYQRSMRERMQEAVPEIARKAPNAVQQDATEFFRTIEGATRVIDVQALGVSP